MLVVVVCDPSLSCDTSKGGEEGTDRISTGWIRTCNKHSNCMNKEQLKFATIYNVNHLCFSITYT